MHKICSDKKPISKSEYCKVGVKEIIRDLNSSINRFAADLKL